MRYPVAPRDTAIKIVTGLTLSLCAAMFIVQFWLPPLIIGALIFSAVCVGCYLRSPVAYEVSSSNLTIELVWGTLVFESISSCRLIEGKLGTTLRLWGNGGLFAATGWFWNSKYGKFRAYMTTSRPESMVMVETAAGKVLITPDDLRAFCREISAH
jgi:hypothetical protein